VTKSELIERVAERAKLTKGRAELVVSTIFSTMVEALKRGDGIEIRGFGSFTVRQYKAYEGRNPRTGDTVHVAPKRLPFFKVGKNLRERVNGQGTPAAAPRQLLAPTRGGETQSESRPRATPRARPKSQSEDVI
jgi:integration host factor subunit beta